MRITDLLQKKGIVIGASVKDKRAAIDKLVELLAEKERAAEKRAEGDAFSRETKA